MGDAYGTRRRKISPLFAFLRFLHALKGREEREGVPLSYGGFPLTIPLRSVRADFVLCARHPRLCVSRMMMNFLARINFSLSSLLPLTLPSQDRIKCNKGMYRGDSWSGFRPRASLYFICGESDRGTRNLPRCILINSGASWNLSHFTVSPYRDFHNV